MAFGSVYSGVYPILCSGGMFSFTTSDACLAPKGSDGGAAFGKIYRHLTMPGPLGIDLQVIERRELRYRFGIKRCAMLVVP